MKAECKPPTACRTGSLLPTDIGCQIFALSHGARGLCAPAWMLQIGKLWVAASLAPCVRVVRFELLEERVGFQRQSEVSGVSCVLITQAGLHRYDGLLKARVRHVIVRCVPQT